jgi:hypothetical protein
MLRPLSSFETAVGTPTNQPTPDSPTDSLPPLPGLTDALLTGGIPPAITEPCAADRTYRALYRRALLQNRRYYAR